MKSLRQRSFFATALALLLVFNATNVRSDDPLPTWSDGKTPPPVSIGDLMFDPKTEYKTRDGHVVTTIGGTPFDVVIYKLGTDIGPHEAMNMDLRTTRSNVDGIDLRRDFRASTRNTGLNE